MAAETALTHSRVERLPSNAFSSSWLRVVCVPWYKVQSGMSSGTRDDLTKSLGHAAFAA
jgi:hypothetical protein